MESKNPFLLCHYYISYDHKFRYFVCIYVSKLISLGSVIFPAIAQEKFEIHRLFPVLRLLTFLIISVLQVALF